MKEGYLTAQLTLYSAPNFKKAAFSGISSIKYYQVPNGGFKSLYFPIQFYLSISICNTFFQVRARTRMR